MSLPVTKYSNLKLWDRPLTGLKWRPVNLSISSSGPYCPNQKLQTSGTNCSNQNQWLSEGYPAHLCQSVKGSTVSGFVKCNLCSVLWGKVFQQKVSNSWYNDRSKLLLYAFPSHRWRKIVTVSDSLQEFKCLWKTSFYVYCHLHLRNGKEIQDKRALHWSNL